MAIYGADISSYQHGLDVQKLAGGFVILKCTEGTYYVDADYASWVPLARASGKTVVAYHFLKTESSAHDQATWLARHIGDTKIPVMLDVETEGASKPGIGLVLETIDTMKQLGLNVRLVYLPHWYWGEIGSPSLTGIADRNVGLVSSNYPGGSVYPGDSGPGWAAYGGVTPMLWQYTSTPLDMNAYKGTIGELQSFLEGDTMTPEEHNWVINLYNGMFYGGSSCGPVVPAGKSGGGSNALFAHIEYITQMLEGLVTAPAQTQMDVKALAAEIVTELVPHLGAQADPTVVAEAVRARLEAALAA